MDLLVNASPLPLFKVHDFLNEIHVDYPFHKGNLDDIQIFFVREHIFSYFSSSIGKLIPAYLPIAELFTYLWWESLGFGRNFKMFLLHLV